MKTYKLVTSLIAILCLQACTDPHSTDNLKSNIQNKPVDESVTKEQEYPATAYLREGEIFNPESVIPPQCYTKTEGVNNPCYVCHQTYQDEKRPNTMNDGALQGEYAFSDVGASNSWKNLFVDRRQSIAKISDDVIKNYIAQDNYTPFIEKLKQDTSWQGIVPEIQDLENAEKAFDENGLAKDGSHWVAFNYKPFPSTFWPTNGSTGDVMIRLPKEFREIEGQYRRDVYFANLALLEIAIKDLAQVSVPEIDENIIQVDLNKDNKLSKISTVLSQETYVGDAKTVDLYSMLYPEDTELLHTVRYLGFDENGEITLSKRMKEVRYMRKYRFRNRDSLKSAYYKEVKEKHFENLPITTPAGYKGIGNGFGWALQGFIEDQNGDLRRQQHEELAYCNGCHKTVGSTIDQTFSFARKVEGAQGWGYINLKAIKDVPNVGEEQGEYLTYMQRVRGGDEFRQNKEMLALWFNDNGQVNKDKVAALDNIYQLIMPSTERALKLNKAYFTIVQEQSFIFGRDATITPATNVLKEVDGSMPPLHADSRYNWDLRLNW
ncbi:hypothetical protein [Catenovulum sediminis]|uniref:hypothetical protein n=1 Tax=Catenovulum sediminis TaxID=1740262 RepID=UPI00117F4CBC|nr:hypothetical protein [Catenovulum sediminis]